MVVLLIVFGGGSGSGAQAARATITGRGCRYKRYPALRAQHYATPTPSPPPKWNSIPPTSGRHFQTPVLFGIYTEPLDEIRIVHNLEHGAVVLQYGSKVPASMVDAITAWYRGSANGLIVAPYPKLGDKVALTAWTQWAECTGFDEQAATAFRKAFRYHGPESFPSSSMDPGE